MNILVVGNHPNFSVEYYVTQALKQLGVNATFLGYREFFNNKLFNITRMTMTRYPFFRNTFCQWAFLKRFNLHLKEMIDSGSVDLVIVIKGEMVFPKTLAYMSSKKIPHVLWFIDDPRFFDSLVRHIAQSYDHVFTSSTEPIMLERYRMISKNVTALPFGCDTKIHRRLDNREKKFDICFVGTYTPFRGQIIKKLRNNGIDITIFGPYWKWMFGGKNVFEGVYGPNMVEVFNQSRLCLNIHDPGGAKHTANMRVFEVTGSGGILLTDYAHGLEKLFKSEEEIFVYRDTNALIEKIQQLLKSEAILDDIRTKAEERAHREHTYRMRMELLLKSIGLTI